MAARFYKQGDNREQGVALIQLRLDQRLNKTGEHEDSDRVNTVGRRLKDEPG